MNEHQQRIIEKLRIEFPDIFPSDLPQISLSLLNSALELAKKTNDIVISRYVLIEKLGNIHGREHYLRTLINKLGRRE